MPYIRVPDPNNPNWTDEDWGGVERIKLDAENPEPFEITEAYWGEGYGWIPYNVRAPIVLGNAEIQYLEQDNQHLIDAYPNEAEDIIWGSHVLILTAGENSGPSLWNGEEGPGWIREEIIGPHRRVTTTKLQRAQAVFRAMLLASDHSCAVTGEACLDVLEAAHIVPVQHGGQEVLSNGILLRSDVHRLFDAIPPRFQISPETGEILAIDFHYEGFDLHGVQIDEELLGRIEEALLWRQENGF